MAAHFPKHSSAAARLGGSHIEETLSLVCNKYISDNPPLPYVYRTYSSQGFRQRADGRYDLDLSERLPDAGGGPLAYAFGMVWSDVARELELSVSCYGPTALWVNGRMVYKSDVPEEVNRSVVRLVRLELQAGWNGLLLRLRRAPSGFGCLIGSSRSKWAPLDVLAPFCEREGQAGWIYSEATQAELDRTGVLPDPGGREADSPLRWYPDADMHAMESGYTLWWSTLRQPQPGKRAVRLAGHCAGELQLFIDGQQVLRDSGGKLLLDAELPPGEHAVVAIAEGSFGLEASCGEERLEWRCPHPVRGYDGAWLCIGGFREPPVHIVRERPSIVKVYKDGTEERYWKAGTTGAWIRPYIENPVYGRWSYPVGVTLYGLLQAGRTIGRRDIAAYAEEHVRSCAAVHDYALWSVREHGYPSVNQQLAEMSMLDDCGSAGSAMLEACFGRGGAAAPEEKLDPVATDCGRIADDIADYMLNRLERKEDGAFYRERQGSFMENTLWADDLYMSVPFLIRYARLRGRRDCLDEAVRQLLLYRNYLFMPATGLMSHVYDFKYNTPTCVPWGRGNGWVLFSLAELLTEWQPKQADNRESYRAICDFFLTLSRGVLNVQGGNGLWHQVLTEKDSYEEASCTAMFVYAFARGVRLGMFENAADYEAAAQRGWQALAAHCIDQYGNVHGVCQGSRYSFSSDYYKHELSWRTNDTHGVGIVLLAGVEVAKLQASRDGRQH